MNTSQNSELKIRQLPVEKPKDTYSQRFSVWFREWIAYKRYRIQMVNDLRGDKSKLLKDFEIKSIKEIFPHMLINSVLITLVVARKQPIETKVLYCIATSSFTYVSLMMYGEERLFYRNMCRDSTIGHYLRKEFLQALPTHEFAPKFREMNAQFENDMFVSDRQQLQEQIALLKSRKWDQ